MVSTGGGDEDDEDDEPGGSDVVTDKDPGAEDDPDFDGAVDEEWELPVVVDGDCPGVFFDGPCEGGSLDDDEDGGVDADDDVEEEDDEEDWLDVLDGGEGKGTVKISVVCSLNPPK
ncbi:hypothetical protein [Sulfobacillus thermosulfidooxidans]|uniref:hypothetical protein n=1 Tax=Sulfobacillus thermosulfidooxidans TaxID=28034 RepID=UPI00096BC886|nr:hypothetical protein [Sulfobacillus thermosulfidooxidans]OLZ09053.1 hypothetical protein BFX05_02300 [Sulfobacillus thermosulfidooxidans]OLZ15193.1 hypothetical protein BFX06_04445 [Sulfobacillus thermosulfidooxidans]OLZ22182.1 hypothetical protein BFX07_09965 [Sulfobacillus thermosulfidooxidans]